MKRIDIHKSFSHSAARARKRYLTMPRPFHAWRKAKMSRYSRRSIWDRFKDWAKSTWETITGNNQRDDKSLEAVKSTKFAHMARQSKARTRQQRNFFNRRK